MAATFALLLSACFAFAGVVRAAKVEPDLVGLTEQLARALEPYQEQYFTELAKKDGNTLSKSASFLSRNDKHRSTAPRVWTAFSKAMAAALDDKTLHLDAELGPPREDSSIFISVSSYRDPTCHNTVKSAFERADQPELVNVGVVQQNCESDHGCMWGSGWGASRAWTARDGKDPDCVEEFCASDMGKPHCDAGRVRILRLGEHQAYGPLFSRYLNQKLWRGENYFMQIDAHTNFRRGWDTTAIDMMKLTPSYPYSVISTYPASGAADQDPEWARVESLKPSGVVYGLCGVFFEQVESRYTMRLDRTNINVKDSAQTGVPPYTSFVAAGFFMTHGSYVDKVPADPFLPYIFMGEEMELSSRMWTAGFDIYAPTVDIVRHEYERHEAPKFWETVNMVYGNGLLHNDVSSLILQRVQNLLGFPEASSVDKVDPPDVLARMDEFGLGKNRTLAAFLSTVGMDVANKRQTVPKWCSENRAPTVDDA